MGKYIARGGRKLSCAKSQIKFGAESLCKEDTNRELSFSVYAFKGRILNSDAILMLKKATVSLRWVRITSLSILFRGRFSFSYPEIGVPVAVNQLFFSPISIISPFSKARRCP